MTAGTPGTAGVPSTAELLTAVGECLADELLPTATGRERYLLQVCVAAIALAGRDLTGGAAIQAARAESYAALGAADAQALIGEIRGGVGPERFAQLVDALTTVNDAELAVLRPGPTA